jgi:hypothetical protein
MANTESQGELYCCYFVTLLLEMKKLVFLMHFRPRIKVPLGGI